jgi:hypothetical protein
MKRILLAAAVHSKPPLYATYKQLGVICMLRLCVCGERLYLASEIGVVRSRSSAAFTDAFRNCSFTWKTDPSC